MKHLLSPKDARTLLAIGSRKLWEMTNRGEIPHLRIGRAIRYDPDDLEEWIHRRKKCGQASDGRWKRPSPRSTSPSSETNQQGTRDDGMQEVG